jgi:psiF repeat-containing protein
MEIAMQKFVLLAGAAALTLFGASAIAQGAAKTPSPRTAASMECSHQADAKGLHGKARKQFRSKCMRGMAKAKAKSEHPLGYR